MIALFSEPITKMFVCFLNKATSSDASRNLAFRIYNIEANSYCIGSLSSLRNGFPQAKESGIL